MNNFILVFLGGGLGSISRYGIGLAMNDKIKSLFPWATLSINILACFILGLLTAWLAAKSDHQQIRLLIGIGFCGGFSTFSTFSAESMALLQRGEWLNTILYIAASVIFCMLAFAAGLGIK